MAATQDAQELFNSHASVVAPLGLVVTEGARELGEKIPEARFLWKTSAPVFLLGTVRR